MSKQILHVIIQIIKKVPGRVGNLAPRLILGSNFKNT